MSDNQKENEKRLSALEDKINYLLQPLLYDVGQQCLFPHRHGISSAILLWLKGRWSMEKRPEAKRVLLEAAEDLALAVPGCWTQEYKEFTEKVKKEK